MRFMDLKIKKLQPKGRFARNIALVASGTILSRLIMLAVIPILTRLYNPDKFAILAIYASLLGIISVIASLRYQLAIPLAEKEKEASALLLLSIIVTSCVSLATFLFIEITGGDLGQWLNNGKINQYIWLLPIGVFLVGLYQAFNYWAIREKDLKVVAETKIVQVITMISIQILFFKFNALALIIGHILGQSAGVTQLAKPVFKSKIAVLKTVTFSEIVSVAKRYKKFPLISTWAGLLNSIGNLVPNLLFASLFGSTSAGLFFMANRIITTPMALLGTAISQSFYTEAVESNKRNQLANLTKRLSLKLFLIIIIPTIILFFTGEELVSFILGDMWIKTGKMIEWLSFMMATQFITSPIS